MPCPPKDLVALKAKLERAKEHIFNLQQCWNGFWPNAYPVSSQDTPDGSYRMYYLGSVEPIPADVPLIAGDAIHNLRSALDHLAYRLVSVGTKSSGPFDRVYFPIGQKPKEFKARIRAIKKCLAPDAVKVLSEIEAYPGGRGEILWQIHELNNWDKHRLLLTLTSQNRLHTMSPAEIARIRYEFAGVLNSVPEATDPMMFLKSGQRHLDLETNHVLGILPIAQVHENMQFPIEIAFGEPQIIKGKPVIELLHQAARLIDKTIGWLDTKQLLD